MKKIVAGLCSFGFLIISITAIHANTYSTSLSYHYSSNWRNGFTAEISEYGGSPVNYKYVEGTYNLYDSDSHSTTGYRNFQSPTKQGQFSWTKTISPGYSMNDVNCVFKVGGTIVGSRSLRR